MPCIVVSVRFHDGRYHGRPDWPPSPARLFQALVAGAAEGDTLSATAHRAFEWLESLDAPVIVAPTMRRGRSLKNFVPNNDLDAVGGNLDRMAQIRSAKHIRPILFDREASLLYVWTFDEETEAQVQAQRIGKAVKGLYQLGRGIDMAWAASEIMAPEEAAKRSIAHGGPVHRPAGAVGGTALAVPVVGSLASLIERHQRMRGRFRMLLTSKPTVKQPDRKVLAGQVFVQPPKPRFREVLYDSPPARLLFDIGGPNAPWKLGRVVDLTEGVRDAAVRKLVKGRSPEEADTIRNTIVGRRDANEADKAARVRIVPLPSIGHHHADHAIRRILVELPPNCPLRSDDVGWAFSGLPVTSDDGEVLCELTASNEGNMLARYAVGGAPAHLWRTVTAAALPHSVARRRIDPGRRHAEAKAGAERAGEEKNAIAAALQAFRHAGVSARPLAVRVQREPFEANGLRVEAFASAPRFPKERLWHVETEFERAFPGPLVIGDGRYLGLGVMAPVRGARRDVVAFSIPAHVRIPTTVREEFLRAVRRALMALSRDDDGNIPPLFSGHETDGRPASSGHHRHVFLAAVDLDRNEQLDHLVVAAPWVCDRSLRRNLAEAALFDQAVSQLRVLRAGRLGVVALEQCAVNARLMGPARDWETHADYRPTRHAGRGKEPGPALLRDVLAECERRRLPKPDVELLDFRIGSKEAVYARLRLHFAIAVPGPIFLGRDSHKGGGAFCAVDRLE